MGWTNYVLIFYENVTHILQGEIPTYTISYIDDVPIQGPAMDYQTANGDYEHVEGNPRIRCFVKEVLNRIVTRMWYSGGTFSRKKSIFIAYSYRVLGYQCTPEGQIVKQDCTQVIRD